MADSVPLARLAQYHRQFHLVAFTDRCPCATDQWPLFSRPAPHAAGRELGLFSGSIPPWFVLSNNLSTINTRAIWLCFGTFLSPPAPSLRIHWPLATDHCSRATDHHSPVPRSTPVPAGSGRAQTLHRWLLPDTDRRFVKDRTGPDLDERSHYHSVCHQTRRFLRKNQSVSSHSPPLTRSPLSRGRRRSTPVAPGAPAEGHQPQCPFSP